MEEVWPISFLNMWLFTLVDLHFKLDSLALMEQVILYKFPSRNGKFTVSFVAI